MKNLVILSLISLFYVYAIPASAINHKCCSNILAETYSCRPSTAKVKSTVKKDYAKAKKDTKKLLKKKNINPKK